MKASDRAGLVFAAVAILLVLAPFFLRLPLIETRGYNPDELEHLHWSWCVWRDLVPYVDYFDHHTPWLHFFLAQLFDFYDVERLPADALGFTFMARHLMWLAAAASLGLTFLLGRSWHDARTGLVAALLLNNTAFFLSKSFEIRPGVPATALLLLSVWLALLGSRRAVASEPGGRPRLFVSGLALGAAVMLTQKVVFVGPGYAAIVFWLLLDRRLELPRATRFGHEGTLVRMVYFAILLTHTALAMTLPVLVPITLWRALRERFDRHRAIARWTLPIWLYVSVTGVLVYLMLYQIPGAEGLADR